MVLLAIKKFSSFYYVTFLLSDGSGNYYFLLNKIRPTSLCCIVRTKNSGSVCLNFQDFLVIFSCRTVFWEWKNDGVKSEIFHSTKFLLPGWIIVNLTGISFFLAPKYIQSFGSNEIMYILPIYSKSSSKPFDQNRDWGYSKIASLQRKSILLF